MRSQASAQIASIHGNEDWKALHELSVLAVGSGSRFEDDHDCGVLFYPWMCEPWKE